MHAMQPICQSCTPQHQKLSQKDFLRLSKLSPRTSEKAFVMLYGLNLFPINNIFEKCFWLIFNLREDASIDILKAKIGRLFVPQSTLEFLLQSYRFQSIQQKCIKRDFSGNSKDRCGVDNRSKFASNVPKERYEQGTIF